MMRTAIDKLVETLLWIVFAAMALVMGVNVLCRFINKALAYYQVYDIQLSYTSGDDRVERIYDISFSLHWGDEVAQILLVWLTFLGAALAVRENENYYLNYVSRKLRGSALRAIVLLRDVISTVAISVLLYYSAKVSWEIRGWIMPSSEISRLFVYGATPVGCVFMLYYAVTAFAGHLRQSDDELASQFGAQQLVVQAE